MNPITSDKVCVKFRGSRSRRATQHKCERRASRRLLCSDLVQLQWVDSGGASCQEIAILENLSLSGLGLFIGVSVPEGIEVQIVANHIQLMGRVQQCVFRENGYIIGLKLDSNFQWTQQPGGNFLPAHMLDVALLDLN
jgi:hypothetical protein